jgi:hypothetical protein
MYVCMYGMFVIKIQRLSILYEKTYMSLEHEFVPESEATSVAVDLLGILLGRTHVLLLQLRKMMVELWTNPMQ